MSEENMLTKEIAEQFLTDEDSVDLSEFTTIEDEAAEVLTSDMTEIVRSRICELVDDLNQFAENSSFNTSSNGGFGEPQETTADALFSLLPKLSCFPLEARDWELENDLTYEFCSFAAELIDQYQITDVELNPINVGEAYLFIPKSAIAAFPDEVLEEFWSVCQQTNSEEFWDEVEKEGYLVPAKKLPSFVASLGPYGGDLEVDSLTALSDEAARSLVKHKGAVFLDCDNLPESVANIFREVPSSPLQVRGLLTKKIAEQFLTDEGSVDLSVFTAIDEQAAEVLSGYDGDLPLESLADLSVTAATFLAGHENGDLWIDGVTELSAELAVALSQHHGRLTFDGLPKLSAEVDNALAARTGVLALNGIVEMTTDIAKILAGSNIAQLELAGLTSLSDAAAASLSEFKGSVHLPEPVAKCPECGVALRTNLSKQCFECGASWRDQ